MKFSFIPLALSVWFLPLTVSADWVNTYREFSFRSEAERQQAEKKGEENVKSAYSMLPDVYNCRSGTLKSEQKRRALQELNAIRRAHDLLEVGYDASKDNATAASALIAAANKMLDHYPTPKLRCYSENGYTGSNKGNLYVTSGYIIFAEENFAESSIASLVVDDNVPSLGHRFWFLDPFLGDISYGRSTQIDKNKQYIDGATVYVGNSRDNVANTRADYVAYPFKNYKSQWFMHDWYSSFSVIVDKQNKSYNRGTVDYSKAEIRVSNSRGQGMKIADISYSDPSGKQGTAGLGNSLQWRVIGTKDNERYHVQIRNVIVNGQVKNYDYWFNIQ